MKILSFFFIAFVIFNVANAASATSNYWVFFSDKGSDTPGDETISTAISSLSTAAIERRYRNGYTVPLDPFDIPPAKSYIGAVKSIEDVEIKYVSSELNAVYVTCDSASIGKLSRVPFVSGISKAVKYTLPKVSKSDGGGKGYDPYYGYGYDQIEMCQLPLLNDEGFTGEGVRVAVIDTGFDVSRGDFSHLDIIGGYDFTGNGDYKYDDVGHGTSVLSVIAAKNPGKLVGPCPDASFLLAKADTYDTDDELIENYWVQALNWAEHNGADICTTSLGYTSGYNASDLDGNTTPTSIAANIAFARGLLVVKSAGNYGASATTITPPADAFGIIAVGAVDENGDLLSFSSRGPTYDGRIKPEVCAPGLNVYCARPDSSYGVLDGTSMSAPIAASAAILTLQKNRTYSANELRLSMLRTGTQSDAPDNNMGYGIVQGYDMAYFDPGAIAESYKPNVAISFPGRVNFNEASANEFAFSIDASDPDGINYWQITVTRKDKPETVHWVKFGAGIAADDILWNGERVDGTAIGSGVYDVHFTAWDRLGYVNSVETKTITVIGESGNLSDVFAYPNPFKPGRGDNVIRITGIPIGSAVTVYTIAGDAILSNENVIDGEIEFYPGQLGLASGVYLYRITDSTGNSIAGKIAIVK